MLTTLERLKVLITVKTYPIPSKKYDELVCTAGVTEDGRFIRLYPINFRELPFEQQYRKYQWIEVDARRHTGRDSRKESYRPECDTLRVLGEVISSEDGTWRERSRHVLPCCSRSLEHLRDRSNEDRTSLGIFKPKRIDDLVISADASDWPEKFKLALLQGRLFEDRVATRQPPRKVPFKFQYVFACDDDRCRGHRMMIEDWEVGSLFWRMVDKGATFAEAAQKVRAKFLDEICGRGRNTHFFVGTILAHPGSWVVIGLFYPREAKDAGAKTGRLFPSDG